jgi:hypothetical protein
MERRRVQRSPCRAVALARPARHARETAAVLRLTSDTPLITPQQHVSKGLKVTYGTRQLDFPRVVIIITLTSRGRRDIPRDAFDDKPVCLYLGRPIVERLKVTTSPSDRPGPSYVIDGSRLEIGPSLLGRRQTTVFSLLVDGGSTGDCRKSPGRSRRWSTSRSGKENRKYRNPFY